MKQVRIKIIDTDTNTTLEDFTSAVSFETIENQAARSSIQLSWDGSDDKYQSLMTSSLTFDLLVRDGADGKFYHLYTGAEDQFRVDLTDENDTLLWSGFLLPDQYSEPYKYPTLFVSMTATDCIGILKGKEYEDYSYYSQEHSVIDFICAALKLTGLKQELYFSPAILPTNGYRWDEIYVNGKLYADEVKKEETDFFPSQKVDNVYDVLERLVHDLGCKLYTWKGKWYLVGINQQHKEVVTFLKYDSNGSYLGVDAVGIESKKVTFYVDPTITVVSPWKTVELTVDLDEDGAMLDEADLVNKKGFSIIPGMDNWEPNKSWEWIGKAGFGPVPRDGKYIAKWVNPGQTIPDFNPSSPTHVGVAGWRTENDVRGSYMQLKNPIWLQGTGNPFTYKFLNIDFELVSYSRLSTKERYENNEFGYTLRYEVLINNEVVYSNFPNTANYVQDALELRYADDSIEWGKDVYYNKDFIESRRKLSGKVQRENYNLVKSGWLQIRIYPPVLVNPKEPTFEIVGIQSLKVKVVAKKEYEAKLTRVGLRYSTKMSVDLFHADNAQDNTNKRFMFKRPGVTEKKEWRESWKRADVNENVRFGLAYARMVHDVQPAPHIKVDGTAVGILEPTQLLEFSWRGAKKFIPTRLTMDFSEAKTELTMIENVYEELFKVSGGIFG